MLFIAGRNDLFADLSHCAQRVTDPEANTRSIRVPSVVLLVNVLIHRLNGIVVSICIF